MELLLPGGHQITHFGGESNTTNFYGNFEEFLLQQGIVWVGNIYNDSWLQLGKLT